jgi:hippurate hydrolase
VTVVDDARAAQNDLVGLRRALHRIPELGLHLPRTQERVLAALDGLSLDVTTGAGLTSVTAVLRGATSARGVLLRADMDALPMVERSGVDYAATGDAMHSCGHDLHTSMLVGAARVLSAVRDRLHGDVVFMFQPGEEGYDGAGCMLDEGVLEATGRRVDAAFAIHVTSSLLPSGVFASRPGPLLAAADVLRVTVRGAGGHSSSPHRARDPVPAACEMVTALQTMVTRRFDVFDPVVITVGTFHAGTVHNAIPDDATFEASIRAFSREAQVQVLEGSRRVCEGIAAAHGLEVDVAVKAIAPVTLNDPAELAGVAAIVRELHGEHRYIELPHPLPASEDFSRVLGAVPGAMMFLGATLADRDPASAPFNHSAEAAFDDGVLADGVAVYAEFALRHLRPQPS